MLGKSERRICSTLGSQKDNLALFGMPPELSTIGQWNDFVTGANKMKTLPDLPEQKRFQWSPKGDSEAGGYSQEALNAADDEMRKQGSGSRMWRAARIPMIIGR